MNRPSFRQRELLLLVLLAAAVAYVGVWLVTSGPPQSPAPAAGPAKAAPAETDRETEKAPSPLAALVAGGVGPAAKGQPVKAPAPAADARGPLLPAPTVGPLGERRTFDEKLAGGPFPGGPETGGATAAAGEATPPAGITGIVVDSRGAPIAGATATVFMSARPGDGPGRMMAIDLATGREPRTGDASARTDERGRFTIQGLKTSGRYRLTVYPPADEFLEKTRPVPALSPGEVQDLGTIVLLRPGAITGFVRDGSGAAVAGATVRLGEPMPDGVRVIRSVGEGGEMGVMVMVGGASAKPAPDAAPGAGGGAPMPPRPPPLPPDPHAVKSDATGRFVLERVPPGIHTVSARAAGYKDGLKQGVAVEEAKTTGPVEITLLSGLSLAVTVRTSHDGAPVAGAKVFVGAGRFGLAMRDEEPQAVTDAAGKALVEGLQSQAASLRVEAAGFARHDEMVDLGRDGRTERTVRLLAECTITGRVVSGPGAEAAAVLDVPIHLEPLEGGGMMRGGPPLFGFSGEDGRFRIAAVPPGLYSLTLQHPTFTDRRIGPLRLAAGQVLDLGDVALDAGGTIEVTVIRDSDGSPVAGARVEAGRRMGDFVFHVARKGVRFAGAVAEEPLTDEAGFVRLSDLEPGTLDVRALADGYAPGFAEGITVAGGGAPAAKVTIALTRGGVVEGTAYLRDRTKAAGATVQLWRSGGDLPVGTALADGEGRFRLERVAAGNYRLALVREGGGGMGPMGKMFGPGGRTGAGGGGDAEGWFTVEDGATVLRDVEEAPVASLRGTVALADGRPAAGHRVRLGPAEAALAGVLEFTFAETVTDAAGAFAVEPVPQIERVLIEVTGPGGAPVLFEASVPGPGVHRVDLRIPEVKEEDLATISGTVRGVPEGAPVAGASIVVMRMGAGPGAPAVRRTAAAGDDGTFAVAELSPGMYRVEASFPGLSLEVVEAAAPAGATVAVALGLHAAGDLVITVAPATPGAPVPARVQGEVRLEGAAPGSPGRGDEGGPDGLVFDRLRAGAVYRYTVTADGYAPSSDAVTLRTDDVTRVTVRLSPR